MIARIIAWCAARPAPVILLSVTIAAIAAFAGRRAPLDAIPDVSDVQVVVTAAWEGKSPDVIEDQITYPISTALIAAPGVRVVRGQSLFGLSFVTVIFDDGTDPSWARGRVLESLTSSRLKLPSDVKPALGPDASGVGWVFQYALVDETSTMNLAELRS